MGFKLGSQFDMGANVTSRMAGIVRNQLCDRLAGVEVSIIVMGTQVGGGVVYCHVAVAYALLPCMLEVTHAGCTGVRGVPIANRAAPQDNRPGRGVPAGSDSQVVMMEEGRSHTVVVALLRSHCRVAFDHAFGKSRWSYIFTDPDVNRPLWRLMFDE